MVSYKFDACLTSLCSFQYLCFTKLAFAMYRQLGCNAQRQSRTSAWPVVGPDWWRTVSGCRTIGSVASSWRRLVPRLIGPTVAFGHLTPTFVSNSQRTLCSPWTFVEASSNSLIVFAKMWQFEIVSGWSTSPLSSSIDRLSELDRFDQKRWPPRGKWNARASSHDEAQCLSCCCFERQW